MRGGDEVPDFRKWFWGKIFDEFEPRDLIVFFTVGAIFALIYNDKISPDHTASVLSGLVGYALGRPGGKGE